jgi:hypothetical protein
VAVETLANFMAHNDSVIKLYQKAFLRLRFPGFFDNFLGKNKTLSLSLSLSLQANQWLPGWLASIHTFKWNVTCYIRNSEISLLSPISFVMSPRTSKNFSPSLFSPKWLVL